MALFWSKKLSRSDAQQPVPRGWPVPYLRLTNSGHPHDTQSWFRDVFFADLDWRPGIFGAHVVEEADFVATVVLPVRQPVVRTLRVTHNAGRAGSGKNTPNTWVHWDVATRGELRANNFAGHKIILERADAGQFKISIL